MLKREYEGQESCSVALTLEIVGERWTWLIIRDAFLGLRTFGEFQKSLGIARNVLSDRLRRLVAEGILERVPYQERPLRYEYRLTRKGADLFLQVADRLAARLPHRQRRDVNVQQVDSGRRAVEHHSALAVRDAHRLQRRPVEHRGLQRRRGRGRRR